MGTGVARGWWAGKVRRWAAAWVVAGACWAAASFPVARSSGPSLELQPSLEVTTLRESGPWPPPLMEQVRQHAAIPLAARTTLRLEWADTFTWPGEAEGAADVSLAVGLRGERPQSAAATEAASQVRVERARFSWLVPGGVLEVGRFVPTWGKGFVYQPSSPFEGMKEAPYSAALRLAGDEAVAEVGWAHSASRPYAGTLGPDPQAEVAWLRLSASGELAEGALAFGHRTGMGPWMSAQLSRPVGDGWQLYGEGILARPYQPVRVVRPEASNDWIALDYPAYAPHLAVRWLAGAWYLSPGGWSFVVEYRYEPGGLDDQEADAFWKAAAGEPEGVSLPPDPGFKERLVWQWSGTALGTLAGLAEDRLPLRRRYLDWALVREAPDSDWGWRLTGTLNLDDGSRSWLPQVSYRIREGATVALTVRLSEGPPSTEYGGSPFAWNVQLTLTGLLD